MLGNKEEITEESKIKNENDDNPNPPPVVETETSKIMMNMGFKSLMSKIYSDSNDELNGNHLKNNS